MAINPGITPTPAVISTPRPDGPTTFPLPPEAPLPAAIPLGGETGGVTVSSAATAAVVEEKKAALKHAIASPAACVAGKHSAKRHYSKQEINCMLEGASEKYGVPPNIVKAVAYHESGWNPRAKSFDGQHGKGVMQIDDRSHKFARTKAVWDPQKNINYGVRLLADINKESGGDWSETLRRYNGTGPAADRYVKKVMPLAESQPWREWLGQEPS